MGAFRLAPIALVQSATFGLAVPISADFPLSLFARGQPTCSNAPNIVAGTVAPTYAASLESRSLLPAAVEPRFPPGQIIFCASGSVTFNVFQSIANPDFGELQSAMLDFLDLVYHTILDQIEGAGDGVIPHGAMFAQSPTGLLHLYLGNANNHQLTWGVAGAAIQAMWTYMQQAGAGTLGWQIWDGMNQVGMGGLSMVQPLP